MRKKINTIPSIATSLELSRRDRLEVVKAAKEEKRRKRQERLELARRAAADYDDEMEGQKEEIERRGSFAERRGSFAGRDSFFFCAGVTRSRGDPNGDPNVAFTANAPPTGA